MIYVGLVAVTGIYLCMSLYELVRNKNPSMALVWAGPIIINLGLLTLEIK